MEKTRAELEAGAWRTNNKTKEELEAEVRRWFELWKADLSGREKVRTPDTVSDWGSQPGEVWKFGLPAWDRNDYHKWLYSRDQNETDS